MTKDNKIPETSSYADMAEFWETHSVVDYWDQTEPAEFDVSPDICHHYSHSFRCAQGTKRYENCFSDLSGADRFQPVESSATYRSRSWRKHRKFSKPANRTTFA